MIDLRTIPARYQRYYTYLEPVMADPLVRGYFSLIASFLLVAFFVVFALSPTINTILALNKKIIEQKTTITALDTKISALITAQQNYSQIESLIPVFDIALPKLPNPQFAVSTIVKTASASAVTLSALQFHSITLFVDPTMSPPAADLGDKTDMVPNGLYVVPFSLSIRGQKVAAQTYLEKLENSLRYIRLGNIGVVNSTTDTTVTVDTSGFAYYYPQL